MTELPDVPEQLRTIREHLHTGALGQREVWEKWLDEAIDELDQLTGSKAALQTEIERLRQLNDVKQEECVRLAKIRDGTERREAEYLALIEKWYTEVARLEQALKSTTQVATERFTEIARLKSERYTTKRMLQDILDKHGAKHDG